MKQTAGLIMLLALAGCTDPDGDGLSTTEERAVGLDPNNPDTDADGLLDGEELVVGTDPLSPDSDSDYLFDGEEVHALGTHPMFEDTDGDGYVDGNEVLEDKDPLNANSRIYQGRWPYHRTKDDIGTKEFTGETVEDGKRVGQWVTRDQFWDEVNLYDFAWEEARDPKYIVLESDAYW